MLAARAGSRRARRTAPRPRRRRRSGRRLRAYRLDGGAEPRHRRSRLRQGASRRALRAPGAGNARRSRRRATGAPGARSGRVLAIGADARRHENPCRRARSRGRWGRIAMRAASSRIRCSQTLELLPEHLWTKSRRKRDYVSGVLARAEVGSNYRPARKLWKRRETGYYAPAPDLKLRRKTPDGETWTPIAEAMNLAAVADGRRRVVFRRLWPRRGRGRRPKGRPRRSGFDRTRRVDRITAYSRCLFDLGHMLRAPGAQGRPTRCRRSCGGISLKSTRSMTPSACISLSCWSGILSLTPPMARLNAVHGAKGAAVDGGRRFDHSGRVHQRLDGNACVQRL